MCNRRSMKWGAMVLALLLVAAMAATGNVYAGALPAKLVIGYQAIPNEEIVAKDLKWHEQTQGIPVEWVEYDSGVHVSEAIAAGKVDIGLVGSSPCALGVARHVPMQVIWIYDIIGDNEALVVRDGAGIQQISDLKGKKIAAPFGSTTHYHLMVTLKLNHLRVSDIQLINLEPRAMMKAWENGEIDGAFVWVPTLAKLQAAGGRILVSSSQLVRRGFPTGDLCVVRKEFGERYPDVVVNYLKVLDRAVKFSRAKPQQAAEAVARQFDISAAAARKQMQGLILLSAAEQDAGKYFGGEHWNFGLYTVLKDTADFLQEEGLVKSLPPRYTFMQAVNASFLVKLLDQLAGSN